MAKHRRRPGRADSCTPGPEEAKAVRQQSRTPSEKIRPLFSLRLQDLEDEFLLAETRAASDTGILRDLIQPLDAHVFEFNEVERRPIPAGLTAGVGEGELPSARS